MICGTSRSKTQIAAWPLPLTHHAARMAHPVVRLALWAFSQGVSLECITAEICSYNAGLTNSQLESCMIPQTDLGFH